jgi:hypothetical protein
MSAIPCGGFKNLKSPLRAPRYRSVKRRFLWLGLAALALGVAVLIYRGPGRAIIRGNVGDVAATMLVYAVIGSLSRARIGWRAAATMVIATAIELGQLVWRLESQAGELLLGTTFDAWDLVAYVAGVCVAMGWDVTSAARRSSGSRAAPPSERSCRGAREASARAPR